MSDDVFEDTETFERERRGLYFEEAAKLIEAVEKYENVHPTGVPCFYDLIDRMKAAVDAAGPGGAA